MIDFDFLRHRLGLAQPGEAASLALPRERLRKAEAELSSARAAMRSAADAAGIERGGLFAGSDFVPRSTADRWYNNGVDEGRREVLDAQIRASGQDPAKVRADIAARLKAERPIREANEKRFNMKMEKLGYFRAVAEKDYAEAGRIWAAAYEDDPGPFLYLHPLLANKTKSKGAAIVRAAARARMSGDRERPEPAKDSVASQILAAGRKRRGEIQ